MTPCRNFDVELFYILHRFSFDIYPGSTVEIFNNLFDDAFLTVHQKEKSFPPSLASRIRANTSLNTCHSAGTL